MRARCLGMVALACVGAMAGAGQADEASNSFAVRRVDVFDGRTVRRGQDVLVKDGLIAAVGRHLSLPPGLPVTEGAGRMLLPGLIDSHVHTWGTSRADALRFGVTTELDMLMDWHLIAPAQNQRKGLAQTNQADLWSAGTAATAPGGHGTEYGIRIPTLEGPQEAQAWMDARVAEGSDYIKIILEPGSAKKPIPTLSAATIAALVTAAHRDGRKVVTHIQTQDSAREAVSAGTDGLAHIFYDQPADADFVTLARERRLFVIPTLSIFSAYSCGPTGPALAHDPALVPSLTSQQAAQLGASFGSCSPQALPTASRNVQILHKAGVPLLAGTDAGNPGTSHGVSLLGEIELLWKAGLTPVEALAAATSVPAEHFGLTGRGRIAAGNRADLLLVEGDPAADPTALRHIAAVWMNGYPVSRERPPETGAASDGFPARFQLVQGSAPAQSPAAVYAGHIHVGGSTGTLDVALGAAGELKGEYRPVADAGTTADQPAAQALSAEWDLLYGTGYYESHVKGNRFHSRALLTGSQDVTLVTEIIGDENYQFSGAARDSRGNLYKVSFGD